MRAKIAIVHAIGSALRGVLGILLLMVALWAERAAGAAVAEPTPFVAFRVEIAAPEPLGALLRSELDLYRWQGYETMTGELLERLIVEARAQAAAILAAQGYFTPHIESRIESDADGRDVRLSIEPGLPTRVSAIALRFSGPVAEGDARDREAMARAQAQWALPQGALFTQAAWGSAKSGAVEALARQRYLLARVASSETKIDPERRSAELAVTLDSGPVIRFGELQIFGLSKYDESRVRNLWTFPADATFDREVVERFQRRLSALQYFANAYVDIDPAQVQGGQVPLRISVGEAPAKRIEFGLRYSTDHGAGGTFAYQNRNFLGRAWRLGLRLDLQQLTQLGEAVLDLPERRNGGSDQLSARLKHSEVENLDVAEWSLGWRRVALEERRQPYYGLMFVQARHSAPGVLSETAYATLPYLGYTWRDTDDLVSPRRGTNTQLEFGIAPPGLSGRRFARTLARIAWYRPLGPRRDLLLQAQGGAVLASGSSRIPQSLLFRTGGSATVRGYDLDSLGVRRGNAVLGGRYLALASAELTQWVSDGFGVAAFIDAGNAAEHLNELRPAYGVGAGLRARTLLGPLRLDLAYGEAQRTWRLHFSIGVSF